MTLTSSSHGNIRYYLGAQVDVSGLLKNCTGLDSLTRLVEKQAVEARTGNDRRTGKSADEAMRQLSQMLNGNELDIVSEHGGLLQKDSKLRDIQEQKTATLQHANTGRLPSGPPRVLIADGSSSDESDREPEEPEIEQFPIPVERLDAGLPAPEINLSGVYKYVSLTLAAHYLILTRPVPPRPPSTIPPRPLRIPNPPLPWRNPIPLPAPHRQLQDAKLPQRRVPRSKSHHRQGQMAQVSQAGRR